MIPQGGYFALECAAGSSVTEVSFASYGVPLRFANGSVGYNSSCHAPESQRRVEAACKGQSHCCLPVTGNNFGADPCFGQLKMLAVEVKGCKAVTSPSHFKRHCSLLGQNLLCDEDIEFLSTLELPEAPQPLLPYSALMVDTSYRPLLQDYVVRNVHNVTGWHIQFFSGPTSTPKLRRLFADLAAQKQITFSELHSDYMEDWQRLSSMMLLEVFWRSVVGEKVLVFQPDSIMCAAATMRITDFTKYEYVGPPMAGPWWMTSDHHSQWGVGCGGFSLRDRAKSIAMTVNPSCITPAAGKLEDQQLATEWKYIEKRCSAVGLNVSKPSRHEAIKFAVEYDLYMDILPGDDPAMPEGCTANYYTGPKMDRGSRTPKWNPSPKPSETQCERKHFVPLGCHKCWGWNFRTWAHMKRHCPEAVVMRKLRAKYKVGIEFTGWPTRPRVRPLRGPALPDSRWPPYDMQPGEKCVGDCKFGRPPKFDSTRLGLYHP